MMKIFSKGFTLIELMITIAIIAMLSVVVMFSVTQYVSKGKDSNISGNLAVLVPAGETYYNFNEAKNGNGYHDFCVSNPVKNAIEQMPINADGNCYSETRTDVTNPAGVCCKVADGNDAWAICARQFTDPTKAFCVDSRGVKRDICNSDCQNNITECPVLSTCTE